MLVKIIRALFCSECTCHNVNDKPARTTANKYKPERDIDTVQVFVESNRGVHTPLPNRPYMIPKPPGPE